MSQFIRMGSALKRAVQQAVGNMERTKTGLYLPPDYVAGKHFGGFHGYEPWIQDCIRACCQVVRGIGPDELSELSAWALWQPADPQLGIQEMPLTVQKHADVMRLIEQFADRIDRDTEKQSGLMDKAREQIRRVDSLRARGTLLVIAMNPTVSELKGELPMSVSAWNPAEVEEAKAVPKQEYLIG